MRILFACLAALCLAACATTHGPDANYQSYVAAHQAATAQHDAQLATIASAAASCPKDDGGACVTAVAGFAAMAVAVGGGKSNALEQYRREPSAAERIGLALVGQLGPLAGAAVQWHSADTARDTATAQYHYLDHVLTGAVNGMATVATNAQPNITVGGNYGNTQTTTVGAGFTGGDRSETNVGRDQTGGDHQDGSVVGNDNRVGSPSDDHSRDGNQNGDGSDYGDHRVDDHSTLPPDPGAGATCVTGLEAGC